MRLLTTCCSELRICADIAGPVIKVRLKLLLGMPAIQVLIGFCRVRSDLRKVLARYRDTDPLDMLERHMCALY